MNESRILEGLQNHVLISYMDEVDFEQQLHRNAFVLRIFRDVFLNNTIEAVQPRGRCGVKLTAGPEEISGSGRNQGTGLVGKYSIEFRSFINGIKNYCQSAIGGC